MILSEYRKLSVSFGRTRGSAPTIRSNEPRPNTENRRLYRAIELRSRIENRSCRSCRLLRPRVENRSFHSGGHAGPPLQFVQPFNLFVGVDLCVDPIVC